MPYFGVFNMLINDSISTCVFPFDIYLRVLKKCVCVYQCAGEGMCECMVCEGKVSHRRQKKMSYLQEQLFFSFLKVCFIFKLHICLCMDMACEHSIQQVQKRVLDTLELQL